MGQAMDEQSRDHAVGYGKPPVASRFQKGQSGNPEGRRRGTKKLIDLMAEALSRQSGFPNADGTWMTQAEVIFSVLVAQAAGSDLKAKRLLFDVMVKLQRANICWPQHRLPEIQLDDSGEDAHAAVAADIERLAKTMVREVPAHSEERLDREASTPTLSLMR
jgi:Family of unknown function (DUF5681)